MPCPFMFLGSSSGKQRIRTEHNLNCGELHILLKGWDAPLKIWITLPKETNVGVAEALFDPLKIPLKT